MRTFLQFTITLLLLPAAGGFSFLRAQSNWTPGYIVSTSIGVGAFGWNRLGLEVRYESGNGFYNLLDISTRTHTFYFLVSSRLF